MTFSMILFIEPLHQQRLMIGIVCELNEGKAVTKNMQTRRHIMVTENYQDTPPEVKVKGIHMQMYLVTGNDNVI